MYDHTKNDFICNQSSYGLIGQPQNLPTDNTPLAFLPYLLYPNSYSSLMSSGVLVFLQGLAIRGSFANFERKNSMCLIGPFPLLVRTTLEINPVVRESTTTGKPGKIMASGSCKPFAALHHPPAISLRSSNVSSHDLAAELKRLVTQASTALAALRLSAGAGICSNACKASRTVSTFSRTKT